MRYFYQYNFEYKQMKNSGTDIFEIADNLIKELGLTYNNFLFRISVNSSSSKNSFEKLFNKYPQFNKFSGQSKIGTSDLGLLTNCLKGSWDPANIDTTDLDFNAFRYIFKKSFDAQFCFNEIPWFKEIKPSLRLGEGNPRHIPFLRPYCSGIIIDKDYSGNIELYVSFEIDETNHDSTKYIEKIEKILGCKYLNNYTFTYCDPLEEQKTEEVKKKQKKLLKQISKSFKQKFKSNALKDNSTISVSNAIKKAIKGTDYHYLGSYNGGYDIHLIDRHNNLVHIYFDYIHRHLRASIDYMGASFSFRYQTTRIETIKSQSEVEYYINWVISLVNKNLQSFSILAQYFPPTPTWLTWSRYNDNLIFTPKFL